VEQVAYQLDNLGHALQGGVTEAADGLAKGIAVAGPAIGEDVGGTLHEVGSQVCLITHNSLSVSFRILKCKYWITGCSDRKNPRRHPQG